MIKRALMIGLGSVFISIGSIDIQTHLLVRELALAFGIQWLFLTLLGDIELVRKR